MGPAISLVTNLTSRIYLRRTTKTRYLQKSGSELETEYIG